MAKDELPLTMDDVRDEESEPVLETEGEEHGEPEEGHEQAREEGQAEEEGRKAALGAFQNAADAAEKGAKEPPKPPAELDVAGWQAMALQDYGDLTDPKSTMFTVTMEKIQALVRNGYQGADLHYKAAQEADRDPRVASERNAERAREARIEASSTADFARTSPARRSPSSSPTTIHGARRAITSRACAGAPGSGRRPGCGSRGSRLHPGPAPSAPCPRRGPRSFQGRGGSRRSPAAGPLKGP